MKTEWSTTWKSSVQPRKQRKYVHNAPQHISHKLVSVHLDKKLREKYGVRALPLRKADEVKIMRGSKKGLKGKVTEVDPRGRRVYIEGQARDAIGGRKSFIPFHPSNLVITSLKAGDKLREKVISRKSGKQVKLEEEKPKKEKPVKKEEKPKETKKEEKTEKKESESKPREEEKK